MENEPEQKTVYVVTGDPVIDLLCRHVADEQAKNLRLEQRIAELEAAAAEWGEERRTLYVKLARLHDLTQAIRCMSEATMELF